MIEYKNDLRIRVQTKKGSAEMPDLNPTPGYTSSLDKEIIQCASTCIKGRHLQTFFLAYHCLETWDDIVLNIFENLKCELEEDTVKKYARDAATTIVKKYSPK